ncbi:MAG: adenylosuccinate lyase [Chloroflexota bacterium]|nr:MAG: adenylosuccinate lyase [Chloroflexota bacterium]
MRQRRTDPTPWRGSSHITDSAFFADQFSTAEMRSVFDDSALLQSWLDAEAALARAEVEAGIVPIEAAEAIERAAKADRLDWAAIKRGIDETFHPIVPVVRELARVADEERPDAGHYVHWGATTQDIMDTGAVLQTRAGLDLVVREAEAIERVLARLAATHADTPMAGRTHGQHALPITFGFKVAVWLAEWRRHGARLADARPRVLVGQLGGAAGTLAGFGADARGIQARFCELLGLGAPPIAWHTARDGFAEVAFVLGLYSATLGKIAREVIALQKTEVAEIEEPWNEGKVGSSTMPHKRNPMICELIDGVSRLTRQEVATALGGMVGEHERDMGPWQAEWEWLPRLFLLTSSALAHGRRVLEGLVVYADRMAANLDMTGGLILSEAIMLRLAETIGRQHAHDVVYEVAMSVRVEGRDFRAALAAEPAVRDALSEAEVAALLDPRSYLGEAPWYARAVADGSPQSRA